MFERARRVRKGRRYARLLERGASRISRGLERRLASRSPLREVAFARSRRELDERMAAERTIGDVLDTTGTFYEPNGAYRGYGPYRSLRALQHRAEIAELAHEVRARDPETVLEIGSANGGTLYVWARVLNGVETLISTDLDYRGRRALLDHFAARSETSLRCIEGDSHEAATTRAVREALAGRPIDFLYLDGDHSYAGVSADFETYGPLVADDGLVGFHDVETSGTGVPRLWSELERAYECRTIGGTDRDGPGTTGILYKGGRS
ncbi:class I SAM-dependent methyltransferase [Halorubrum sp. AD140]|uniref:class I SAM-dependent methyltransferase n=1 Tax=Halorubrum sp. AD140 TaxID=3050073 RepID=UPI002ACCBB65|nr:class I SAM-dependent methyltransferase [Halorubrum sp. AD140]MDZ5811769.1 class I SAM-dependent methyltransferase [Halorubrum sp. AD140]